jgi:hypothetical protein
VAQVDLDLAEVFPLLQQMRRIRVPQGMDVGLLGNATGLEREPEGALERGAAHRLGGGADTPAAVAFGGEKPRRMAVGFPLLPQQLERALRQGDVAVLIALAGPDMQEHATGIDIADLEAQPFAQAQATGVDGRQAHPMVQGGYGGKEAAHLVGRQNDRQLELRIGPDQLHLVRPGAAQGLFPENLDRADGLGAGLAGHLLVFLEVDAILAEVFGAEQIGGFTVELAQLAQACVISLLSAWTDGQQLEIIGERF